jgi:hypothetical protein
LHNTASPEGNGPDEVNLWRYLFPCSLCYNSSTGAVQFGIWEDLIHSVPESNMWYTDGTIISLWWLYGELGGLFVIINLDVIVEVIQHPSKHLDQKERKYVCA